MFLAHNILPINTDNIYREITSQKTPCIEALISEFGGDIVNGDFSLNRKRLSEIVFSDKKKLNRLNKLSHYHVLNEVRKIIKNAADSGYFGVIVDAPLLFESGFDTECDLVIAVVANESTRINRILARDNITPDMAKKRLSAQLSDEVIKSRADYVIDNSGDASHLAEEVEKIIKEIKNKFK